MDANPSYPNLKSRHRMQAQHEHERCLLHVRVSVRYHSSVEPTDVSIVSSIVYGLEAFLKVLDATAFALFAIDRPLHHERCRHVTRCQK